MRFFRGSKFGNIPTLAADGRIRQSRKEAENANKLKAAQDAGIISDVESQKTYRFDIYGQPETEALLEGIDSLDGDDRAVHKVQQLAQKVRESRMHVTSYVADHVFQEKGQKRPSVADTKGRLSGPPYLLFQIKARLMRICYGIDVEVWI